MRDITHISAPGTQLWKSLQAIVWSLGLLILLALFFAPEVGTDALWNVLIPIAPFLLVFSPGIWRNICPLGTTSLLPRYSNTSQRKVVTPRGRKVLGILSLLLLFLIVPLRHVLFDTNGLASGILLLLMATTSLVLGRVYDWKSAWCSGLCPVHPVEKLYGIKPVVVPRNAHCQLCHQCVVPCPDSTKSMNPLSARKGSIEQRLGTLLVGSFPGFIWGWFQVPDYTGLEGWGHIHEVYLWPLLGGIVTLSLFTLLHQIVPKQRQKQLSGIFACAAVICYYWFRLPLLFGFGAFPGTGMLVDLSSTFPSWFPLALQGGMAFLCVWLLLGRNTTKKQSWTIRPPFAGREEGEVVVRISVSDRDR